MSDLSIDNLIRTHIWLAALTAPDQLTNALVLVERAFGLLGRGQEVEVKVDFSIPASTPVQAWGGAEWTAEEEEELRRRWEAGEATADISEAMGRSSQAINMRLGRLGVPKRRPGGLGTRPWTAERDALLRDLWAKNLPASEIAPQIEASVASVYWRAGHLSLPKRDLKRSKNVGTTLVEAAPEPAPAPAAPVPVIPQPTALAPAVDLPKTFNTYPPRDKGPRRPIHDGLGPKREAGEEEAIAAAVAAGRVTKVAPGYHAGHRPDVIKDLA